MGKVIAITSGKGGTGKTTVAAAISSCLAVLGHRTLCIDFDAQLKNLDLALGMTDFAVKDFMDVVSGDLDIMAACTESPMIPNLFFLSAPTSEIPENVDVGKFKAMFNDIRENFDFCFIDTPAGIGSGFRLAHTDVDMSIIVTTCDSASMRDANRTASAVRSFGNEELSLRLIVNRVLPKNLKIIKTNIDDTIDTVGVQLLGIIPEDKYMFRALHDNVPLILYKRRLSAHDFLDAARRIAGEDIPLHQSKWLR